MQSYGDYAVFEDREDAGRELAKRLTAYAGRKEALVLAIPRGGGVTGAVVANRLGLPLDIVLTKKIGHPDNPEYAIGVVNLSSELVDEDVVAREGVSREYLARRIEAIRAELRRRYEAYRGRRPAPELEGKTVILVDDGIATGNTMLAAVALARREKARKVVVAVPVGPRDTIERLRRLADEVACVSAPSDFFAIGQFYETFGQVEDEEAMRLLRGSRAPVTTQE